MAGVNLTARRVRDFMSTASERARIWDAEVPGLSLLKLKNGGSWRIIYRADNGKERNITLGRYPSITLEVARDIAKAKKVDLANGIDPLKEKARAQAESRHRDEQTIKAYLDGAYTLAQSRKKGGDNTLGMLRKHFSQWDDRSMYSLTNADIDKWQSEREAQGLTRGTISRVYGALQTMLNHAVKRGAIEANPIKGVKLEAVAMTEEELSEGDSRRYLEDDETVALFAALNAYQDEKRSKRRNSRVHGKPYLPDLDKVAYVDHVLPFILVMYYTGFRPGDIFGLRWEHVNLPFKRITKTIEKTAHHHPEPRTFPLSDKVVEVLKTWWKQNGKPKTGYVFVSPKTGTRFGAEAMQRPWAKIRKLSQELAKGKKIKAGLPDDMVMYSLRHNFASQLIMSGSDLLTVSKLMAHDDINTTIKHYAHLKPDHARDYVNVFASKQTPGTSFLTQPDIKQG